MQHEMTQRVAVLLDVLFVCGSNAYTKSCGISPQGKLSFGCCLRATDQDLQLMEHYGSSLSTFRMA
jgi:hypothetical protein